MKKYLPKTVNNPHGFTLVELLVVVSIIAILSVIGLAIFGGIQKSARDARRKADIDSIAQAMEINYGKSPTPAGQYSALADNMFSSGLIPKDPVDTNAGSTNTCPGVCKYCVREGALAQTGAACEAGTAAVAANAPSGGATNINWVVCANLEVTSTFYCRGNQQ